MNVCTLVFSSLLITTLLLLDAPGKAAAQLQWTPTSPEDGHVLHACAGGTVTISWNFTLPPEYLVHNVVWYFRGSTTQEMVAIFAQGTFLPTASFGQRVTFLPDAGIALEHVTKGDSGNFSVTVTGHDSRSGMSFQSSRTVSLDVEGGDLMTTDHRLHARQEASVQFSNTSQDWHAVLSCGTFTYPAHPHPPVDVEWLTPDGRTLSSSLYADGQFRLLLDNPVLGGNYTCRVAASSLNASCAQGQGLQASVSVSQLPTRLTLLEARQDRLQDQLRLKDGEISQLKDTILNQSSQVESMQTLLSEKQHQPVAFTAKSLSSQHLRTYEDLVFPLVMLNEGGCYNDSTGRFMAPVTGTYYVAAMTASYSDSIKADLVLKSSSGDVFYSYVYNHGQLQTGSLQGALRLQSGEEVWVTAGANGGDYVGVDGTVFSGFLVSVG